MLLNSQIHYRRNFLIAIIVSETLIISAFVFSPGDISQRKIVSDNEPILLFDEIPQTVQNQTVKRHKPKNPQIYISDEVEAFELLEDVNISINTSDQNDNNSSVSTDQSNVKTMQSVPRLIFEVIPADGNNEFKGKLQLSLKINKKGQVVDHRIIFNSLDCTNCLNDVIKAAYKSKWEPAFVNGTNTDFWVVKSYKFN